MKNQSMTITDTYPKMEEYQLELLRKSPAWKKADMAGRMFMTMKQLALQGLKTRFPQASEDELRQRLADVILGEELAEKVYGMFDGD